jgi:hypothetical protein
MPPFTLRVVQTSRPAAPALPQQPHGPVANGWKCTFCDGSSIPSTEVCQQCGKPKTDVSPKPVAESKVKLGDCLAYV